MGETTGPALSQELLGLLHLIDSALEEHTGAGRRGLLVRAGRHPLIQRLGFWDHSADVYCARLLEELIQTRDGETGQQRVLGFLDGGLSPGALVLGVPDDEQIRLIQSLVPGAAPDPTTLDTGLARLVLAGRDRLTSQAVLDRLRAASATSSWEPRDPVSEMVTSFIP